MSKDEAIAWLTGQRSVTNMMHSEPRETLPIRIAEADAAMMQQAYYVLKAYSEGLI